MLKYLSNQSALLLTRKLTRPHADNSIYIYGFSLLYSSLFIIMSVLFISSLISHIQYGLCFFLIFIPLRTHTGGYHSESYSGCFVVSNFCFILAYFIATYCLSQFNATCKILITLLISIYTYAKSPIGNKNHPIPDNLICTYKFKAGVLLTIYFLAITVLCAANYMQDLVELAIATLFIVASLIYIMIKKGETNDYRNS